MEWPQCLNGTAVLLSLKAQADPFPPETSLDAAWLALTCSWLTLLLWGAAAATVAHHTQAVVSPHVVAAWEWTLPRLQWLGRWTGLVLEHGWALAMEYSRQAGTILLAYIVNWYGAVMQYLSTVDPVVYRQLAVAALWLIGSIGAYKWMERRGYFLAAQRRYRRAADLWGARCQCGAARVRSAVDAGKHQCQAAAAAVTAACQKVQRTAVFVGGLPQRGYRAVSAKARAAWAAVVSAYWSAMAVVRHLLGAPLRAWRATTAAARRAQEAAFQSLHQGKRACWEAVGAARHQLACSFTYVCGLPRRLVDELGRQKGIALDRCQRSWRLACGWLQGQWEKVQPTVAQHWKHVRVAQPHVLYWALVGSTMQLLPGTALAVVEVLFHGPWVVDFVYPACRSLYALHAEVQNGAGGAADFRVCLKYWVVFFNLHLLCSLVPEAALSTISFPGELRLFFSLWLQLPFTNGVAPLFTVISFAVGSYSHSVRQPAWMTAAPDSISAPMRVTRYLVGGWVSDLVEAVLHSWHLVWYCIFFFTPGFVTAYGCLFAGILLPTTTTLSTLEVVATEEEEAGRRQRGRQQHWLRYWLAFTMVHVVFHRVLIPLFGFLPMLQHLQLCLIILLQLPNQLGARLATMALWFLGKQVVQTGRYTYCRLNTPRGTPAVAPADDGTQAPEASTSSLRMDPPALVTKNGEAGPLPSSNGDPEDGNSSVNETG